MGWLFMFSLEGYAGPREYLDAQFTFDRPDRNIRVLRSALVGMKTYYAALELTTPERPRQVCAMICLVKYNPRDRRGEIFGFKDMDETMGPFEARCSGRHPRLAHADRQRPGARLTGALPRRPGPSKRQTQAEERHDGGF